MEPIKEVIAGVADLLCPVCQSALYIEGEEKKILVCRWCGYHREYKEVEVCQSH